MFVREREGKLYPVSKDQQNAAFKQLYKSLKTVMTVTVSELFRIPLKSGKNAVNFVISNFWDWKMFELYENSTGLTQKAKEPKIREKLFWKHFLFY